MGGRREPLPQHPGAQSACALRFPIDMTAAPRLEFAFELNVEVAKPKEVGEIGWGNRRVVDILGGRGLGPERNGPVEPGGADFQMIRPNHLAELHARYTIEADDGAL